MLKLSLAPPSGSGAATARLTWPDVVVILAAVGFTVFLNLRAVPIVPAVAIAGGTMLMFVGLVAVPRRLGEIVRGVGLLRAAAEEAARRERS